MNEKLPDLTGKGLLISAKCDGFRRGGIAHPVKKTLRPAADFSEEQLRQILAENGKDLTVEIVDLKKVEVPKRPAASESKKGQKPDEKGKKQKAQGNKEPKQANRAENENTPAEGGK